MNDSTHECPGPGCKRRVPQNKLACPRHWSQVPPDQQSAVYTAYRMGDYAAHAAAMNAAIAAMKP